MTKQVEKKQPFKIRSIPFGVRVLAVLLVLTLALGYMIGERLKILANGTEIILKTKPVDPRDFFRGHYARLRFDIAEAPTPPIEQGLKNKRNDTIFVSLEKGEDGFWQAVSSHRAYPPKKAGTIVIKGSIRSASPLGLRVSYGIERYFAPKAEALKLENLDREKTEVSVIARISKSGEAAISGLMINGKKIYEEPLF